MSSKVKEIEVIVENTFLPVGSVVMLKGATTPLVIMGFAVVEKNNKDKIWDYIGVMYPVGFITPEKNLMFNRDQIEKVLFEGYSDENEKLFRLELERNLLTLKR